MRLSEVLSSQWLSARLAASSGILTMRRAIYLSYTLRFAEMAIAFRAVFGINSRGFPSLYPAVCSSTVHAQEEKILEAKFGEVTDNRARTWF